MTRPPFDLEIEALDAAKLERLAQNMGLERPLADWMAQYHAYQADEDVRENSSSRLRL